MKTVNFIEAVEYAKRGKEVYFELLKEKYFIYFDTYKLLKRIIIVDESNYKKLINKELKEPTSWFTNIEFYLNKWTIKDE